MDGAMDRDYEEIEQSKLIDHDPPDWITTQQLDDGPSNAVILDSSARGFGDGEDFEEVGKHLADGDDDEDEAEQRRSALTHP